MHWKILYALHCIVLRYSFDFKWSFMLILPTLIVQIVVVVIVIFLHFHYNKTTTTKKRRKMNIINEMNNFKEIFSHSNHPLRIILSFDKWMNKWMNECMNEWNGWLYGMHDSNSVETKITVILFNWISIERHIFL